jgi:hypothetical protein
LVRFTQSHIVREDPSERRLIVYIRGVLVPVSLSLDVQHPPHAFALVWQQSPKHSVLVIDFSSFGGGVRVGFLHYSTGRDTYKLESIRCITDKWW